MSVPETDPTACDREPIHIPGSIQPHGVLLVIEPPLLVVRHQAGDAKGLFGRDAVDLSLAELLGEAVAAGAQALIAGKERRFLDRVTLASAGAALDIAIHMSGSWLIVELERAPPPSSSLALLPQLDAAAAAFERAADLQQLCQVAAAEFRRVTGYDRVMVYRFLEDDAGVVLGENAAPGQHAFLNHHFPASDIPKQARALYVRNRVRVIPDVSYTPAPLRPAWSHAEPLDMSDSVLRSVSPIHIQYLKNMDVAASASISIVKDGGLWGLIACHHGSPRGMPADVRAACSALAGGLSRQIKAREETGAYRERVRLRRFEDDIVALLSREGSLHEALSRHLSEIMRMLDSDGVAVLRGSDLVCGGRCPAEPEVRRIADWVIERSSETVFATDALLDLFDVGEQDRAVAAGLLAVTLSPSERWVVMWFRAEHVQVVNWAGNPHKSVVAGSGGALNPRASFEAWSQTVRGRARRWTIPEVEAAGRLRIAVVNVWQGRRIQDLNRQLLTTLEQKELLIRQKDFLLGEVNHRVQNSLQIVSSFLTLQARESTDAALQAAIEEARRRIVAVSLVHRRLYSGGQLESLDAARYIEDLLTDLVSSLGRDWERHLVLDLQPIMLPNDRAVSLGLVLTELVINVNKYAYGGAPGSLSVTLTEDRNLFRLIVADEGAGRGSSRKGFGSRMMGALVDQLGGTLEYADNHPGTRATLIAPIERADRR